MCLALLRGDRRGAGPGAAGQGGDRQGHRPTRHDALYADRRHLPDLGGRLRDRHLRADLPGRLGRPAGAAGPAAEAVRPPAVAVDRVLLRNSAGVVISRMTNDVEALDQLVEDGLATLIQSSLTLIGVIVILMVMDFHLALLTFIALPFLFVGALAFRIASAGAYRATREKIAAITGYLAESLSGIRAVRSFGQEQRHVDRFARAQRGEPRGEHDDGQAQRRLLPGGRAAVGAGHRRDPARRRPGGDRRPRVDRRRVRVHRRAQQLLRPAPAALAAVHDLPVGDGGARQDLRPARRAARDRRRARRDHAAPDRGPSSSSATSRSATAPATTRRGRCATSTSIVAARPDDRARRRDRRRQVDVRQARLALL